jgi:hypothetical protein
MLRRMSTFALVTVILLQAANCRGDLLKSLIEQNEAARAKIKTAEYKVKWTQNVEVKEGLRRNEGFGEVKMKGDWRYSTQECNASVSATGWKQKQTQSMVINDKYLAYWPTIGNAYIYQDDHQSVKELSDDAKLRRNMHTTPDIFSFDFAFGGERETTFREMMKLHPDKIRWTAEEPKQLNGDIVYLIKRYSPFMNDPAKPDGVWTIDPQKGFLVTQAVFYSRAGNVWVTRKTEPKEIGSGIWIPVSYQEHRYGKSNDPQAGKKPNQSTIIQLEDISVNQEIPDECFTIESILPEEHRAYTTLFRQGLDGNTEAYVYKNGRYVLRTKQDRGSISLEDDGSIDLVGKPLPALNGIKIDFSPDTSKGKAILLCFFDMEQRPSRYCVAQLAEQAEKLGQKGVNIAAVQASKIEQDALNEWLRENNVSFPVGMLEDDKEQTRFNWPVKSLPRLILTDNQHIVRADGFGIDDLEEKIKTLTEE